MKISKIRNVKTPTRANTHDAGVDLYIPEDLTVNDIGAIPQNKGHHIGLFGNKITGLLDRIVLEPGKRILLPSGIKANVPEGYAMLIYNKSGVASKTGLTKLAEVIDSGYQGEIHINVVNTSKTDTVVLIPGTKIVQFLLVPISTEDVELTDIDDLYTEVSNRGSGGFGSTDKKEAVADKPNKKVPTIADIMGADMIEGNTNSEENISWDSDGKGITEKTSSKPAKKKGRPKKVK